MVLETLELGKIGRFDVWAHLNALVVEAFGVKRRRVFESRKLLCVYPGELLALGFGNVRLVEFGHFGVQLVRRHAVAGLAFVVLDYHLFRLEVLNRPFVWFVFGKDL